MSLFSGAIIESVYSKLIGNSTLMGLVNNEVHDHVPQNGEYPFIAIGELFESEMNTDDDKQGSQASLTIHTYSRKKGRDETNTIQAEINRTLHRKENEFIVSGFNFILIDEIDSGSFVDADGITRHGTIELKILISEV